MGNNFNTKIIYEYIRNNNLTNEEFCEVCHISYNDLQFVIENNYDVSIIVVARIAKQLNVKLYEMFI